MHPRIVGALALVLLACGQSAPNEASPRQEQPSLAPPAEPEAPAAVLLGPHTGATLRAAREGGADDFFQWFHWNERGREPAESGLTRVSFILSGREAPNDAQLEVVVDREDRIVSMALRLTRAFLDGENAPRARDVAKSFVIAATPAAAAAETEPLVTDIHWRPIPGFHTVAASGAPDLPAEPTDGYLAFTGARPSYRAELTGARMRIETIAEGGPWIEIAFRGARTTAPRTLGCIRPEQADSSMTPVEIYASLRVCVTAGRYPDAFFLDALGNVYAQFDARRAAAPNARAQVDELHRATFARFTFDQLDPFLMRLGRDPAICARIERVGPPRYFPSYLVGDPAPDALVSSFDAATAWNEAREYVGCHPD